MIIGEKKPESTQKKRFFQLRSYFNQCRQGNINAEVGELSWVLRLLPKLPLVYIVTLLVRLVA